MNWRDDRADTARQMLPLVAERGDPDPRDQLRCADGVHLISPGALYRPDLYRSHDCGALVEVSMPLSETVAR